MQISSPETLDGSISFYCKSLQISEHDTDNSYEKLIGSSAQIHTKNSEY